MHFPILTTVKHWRNCPNSLWMCVLLRIILGMRMASLVNLPDLFVSSCFACTAIVPLQDLEFRDDAAGNGLQPCSFYFNLQVPWSIRIVFRPWATVWMRCVQWCWFWWRHLWESSGEKTSKRSPLLGAGNAQTPWNTCWNPSRCPQDTHLKRGMLSTSALLQASMMNILSPLFCSPGCSSTVVASRGCICNLFFRNPRSEVENSSSIACIYQETFEPFRNADVTGGELCKDSLSR